jgi:hypothetical protein
MHVGYTHCYITLTEEQDTEFATLKRTPGINPKVQLRASIIRLSSKRKPVAWLVAHFKRSRSTIEADLDRFDQYAKKPMPESCHRRRLEP